MACSVPELITIQVSLAWLPAHNALHKVDAIVSPAAWTNGDVTVAPGTSQMFFAAIANIPGVRDDADAVAAARLAYQAGNGTLSSVQEAMADLATRLNLDRPTLVRPIWSQIVTATLPTQPHAHLTAHAGPNGQFRVAGFGPFATSTQMSASAANSDLLTTMVTNIHASVTTSSATGPGLS